MFSKHTERYRNESLRRVRKENHLVSNVTLSALGLEDLLSFLHISIGHFQVGGDRRGHSDDSSLVANSRNGFRKLAEAARIVPIRTGSYQNASGEILHLVCF